MNFSLQFLAVHDAFAANDSYRGEVIEFDRPNDRRIGVRQSDTAAGEQGENDRYNYNAHRTARDLGHDGFSSSRVG